MTSFVPKMLVVSNRHKLHINSSYLATLYSCIPEFMRKRSVLTVAQTTQKFVGKLSLQEISTLAIIREISASNLRGTQRGFLLTALKTLFRLSRVLSDLWISGNAGGAIKFVPVRSSLGSLSLFEITRASVLFSRKF